MNDIDVILSVLAKERESLHQQLMQIDRIIKRAKSGNYSDAPAIAPKEIKQPVSEMKQINAFSTPDNMKIHVVKVFDIIGKACKLKTVQTEYSKLTGNNYNIRETLRGLQNSGILRVIKLRANERAFMWVKRDWIQDNTLKEEYKPDGFNLIYKDADLIFQ